MTQCLAALILKGEHYFCDNPAPHDGWSHGNRAAEAIWRGSGDTDVPALPGSDDRQLADFTGSAPAAGVLEGRLWWHRLRGHKIHRGLNILGGSTPYLCEPCNKTWVRSWV